MQGGKRYGRGPPALGLKPTAFVRVNFCSQNINLKGVLGLLVFVFLFFWFVVGLLPKRTTTGLPMSSNLTLPAYAQMGSWPFDFWHIHVTPPKIMALVPRCGESEGAGARVFEREADV